MNKKIFNGFMIASMFLMLITFVNTCSINRKLNKVDAKVEVLQHSCDSLITIVEHKTEPATPKNVKDEMQRIMLDFLIYEDDLDKGKTSLSAVKDKIEQDDEK